MNNYIGFMTTIGAILFSIALIMIAKLLFQILFIRYNFKKLRMNTEFVDDISYSEFEELCFDISDLLHYSIGSFEIVDCRNEHYCILRIKKDYYFFDGNYFYKVFDDKEMLEDRLFEEFEKYSKKLNLSKNWEV